MASSIDGWYAKRDKHPVVEQWKRRARKKPRGSREALTHQLSLGAILLALDREREALAVLDVAAAAVKWTGKTDPWFIAGCCAALALWTRQRKTPRASPAALAAFAAHEAHAAQALQADDWTKQVFAADLQDTWAQFADARDDDSPDAIGDMAFHLGSVAYSRMFHVIAPRHAGKVPARSTDAALTKGLAAIADRLDS